jgi:hypothetical protein
MPIDHQLVVLVGSAKAVLAAQATLAPTQRAVLRAAVG